MLKYMYTFESYSMLDMPVNPSFSAFEEFKNYLGDPEIKDLVDRLNNLWWEMEQGNVEDEVEMNEYGAQLEELEEEIRELIHQKENEETEELEDEGFSYEIEELNELFERKNLNVRIISEDTSSAETRLKIDVDGDELDAVIGSQGELILVEGSNLAYMGNIYDDKIEILNKFKELANAYGDEYLKFFKDNEASI